MSAAPTHKGGALYVPASKGLARISNPSLYDELYFAGKPEAAIAESFGNRDVWSDTMFDHPQGRYALATFGLGDSNVCDLDNAKVLVSLKLNPSRVVTRQRPITQAWSASIFRAGGFDGISRWSYHFADWASFDIWSTAKLRLTKIRSLSITDDDVGIAASTIIRSMDAAG